MTKSQDATPSQRLDAKGSHKRGCTYNFSDPRCQCATPKRLDAATVERKPDPFDDPEMFPGLRVIVPDWFVRNADRSNPKAAINYDAAYFGDECAALINGTRRAFATEPHQQEGGA